MVDLYGLYENLPEGAEWREVFVWMPSEEMAGRMIGREGRNARAFQEAAGLKVEIVGNHGRWWKVCGEAADVDPMVKALWKMVTHKNVVLHPAAIGRVVTEERERWKRWYLGLAESTPEKGPEPVS